MVKFRDIKPKKNEPIQNLEKTSNLFTGSRLSFQHLDSDKKKTSDVKQEEQKKIIDKKDREKLYNSLFIYVKKVFESIRNQQEIDLNQGFDLVQKITENRLPKDPVFIKAIHHDSLENYYIFHCVNTAVYAVKMADNLKWPVEKQIETGVGALLHDVGMAMVPEKIIYKKEVLTEKEYQVIRNRATIAYKILQSFSDIYAWLPICALQAHERIDGSGYPQGLKAEEIHDYAQLTGLAGIYEALIHSRPQGERYLYSSAAKEIIRTGKKSFKNEYLKALLNVFSIFPLYSYVRLNTDVIGEVIETYPNQPMRPRIRIVYNIKKRSPVSDEQIINLPDNSLLNIVDSVSEREVRGLS